MSITLKTDHQNKVYESLHYMLDEYPTKSKSWWDLNFTLFETQLARLQHACQCRTGQQLPGCCAHTSSFLWLLFHALKDSTVLNKITSVSKRDSNIIKNVQSMVPFKKYQKQHPHHFAKGCWCQKNKNEPTIHCQTCNMFVHPSCAQTQLKHINKHSWTKEAFWCKSCNGYLHWITING